MTAVQGYHWFRRSRVCIALRSGPGVAFGCGDETVAMAAGETWLIDDTRPQRLRNASPHACLHLLVELRAPAVATGRGDALVLEPYRFEVLEPDELVALTARILDDPPARPRSDAAQAAFVAAIARIRQRFTLAFQRFGHDSAGELAYQDVILELREQILPWLAPGTAGMRAATVIDTMLAISPPTPRRLHRPTSAAPRVTDEASSPGPVLDRPVFVVSAPRSGSTLLFELLSRFPALWSIGGESHALIRGIPELHPAARGHGSDRLTAAEASPAVAAALRDAIIGQLVDRSGQRLGALPPAERPARVRLLEKTPANALRIPFLLAVFPDAFFVHLRRDPREVICSLVEGWRSRRFVAYRELPGWPHRDWSFLLTPGWASLADRPLVEIAAHQWKTADATIEHDLRVLPPSRRCEVRYEELVRCPRVPLHTIAELAGLAWDAEVERAVVEPLPPTRVTLSAPSPDKWRRHEHELAALLPAMPSDAARPHAPR
jgi:Sulfotransferase family